MIFRERRGEKQGGKEREKEAAMYERNSDWLPPVCAPSGDQTGSTGTGPDWESDLHPFELQAAKPPGQG